MSRITKTIAEATARELVAGKQAEIKALREQEAKFITEIYEASLSKLILDAFKKHKGFIYSTSSIRISGVGLTQGYKNYPLSYELPNCNSCKIFPVDDNQADIIANYESEIEEKQKQARELLNNIEAALLNLRTYNNVQKEFPEAFKLLPVSSVNTGLMINLKDIRCKLDSTNC